MNLLPYEHLKISTRLSTNEVCEKLSGVVELGRNAVWFKLNHKPYQGKLADTHFEVVRVPHYRGPRGPIIKGDIQPEMSGSSIYITIHPIGIFAAIPVLMLGLVGYLLLSAIGSLISSAIQGNMKDPSILIGLVIMFAIIYVFLIGPFKFESRTSKEFFCELFQAEAVEELGKANPFWAAG